MEVPEEHKKPLKEFTKTGSNYREFLAHINQQTIINNQLAIDRKLNSIGQALGIVKKQEPKSAILTPHTKIIGKV